MVVWLLAAPQVLAAGTDALEIHVRRNPDDLKSVYKLGVLLLKENKPKKALKYLMHLKRKKAGSGSVLYAISRAYYQLKEIPEAVKTCSKIRDGENLERCRELEARAKSEFPDSYNLYRAEEHFSKKEYEESMGILEELLSIEVENPKYRFLLGKIYHVQKKFDYAWDQYRISQLGSVNSGELKKLVARLRSIGSKALEFVNQTKTSIDDKPRFYDRFYFALKLSLSDTRLRAGGFISRAIQFFKESKPDMDPFDFQYRLGYFYTQNSEFEMAKEAYEGALDEAPDDYLYTTVESLIAELEKRSERETKVIDLVSSVGGEDAYRMLQEAALKADEIRKKTDLASNQSSGKNGQVNSKLNMDKDKFIAEFENYKRKIQNASSGAEKNRLMQEMQSKYGHLFKDPQTRKQLEGFLKSSEGKKLQDQYKDKIDEYREVVNQYK